MDENPTGAILIVDDEPAMCEGLGALLTGEGYNVASAGDGAEALAKATALVPDLVLLDVKMPGLDGFEVCRRLRADPLLAEIPIIMLTTLADRDSRLQGFEAGADDFVSKPFDEIELLTRVRSITRLNRYRRLLQAQAALRESEERFRALFDGAPIGLYRTTPDGRILDANPALVNMLDYPDRESFLATGMTDIYVDIQDRQRWQSLLEREGIVRGFETQLRKYDGTPIWVQENTRVIRDDTDRVLYYEGAIEDVTERKRAEDLLRVERDRAQQYLDIAEVMLIALNREGEVTLINRKGCHVLGYEDKALLGKNWFTTCLPVSVRDSVRAAFGRLIAGEIESVEYYENPVLTRSGKERMIAWHNTVLRDETGHIVGTLSSGEDITERKRAEEEIQRRNRELMALNEIGQAVTSSLNLRETLTLVAGHATRLMNMAATSVLLYDEARDDLYFAAAAGEGADFVLGRRLALGQGIAGWVVEHGEPALVPDVTQDPHWESGFDQEGGFTTRAILCVPLKSKGRIIGALEAINKEGGFGEDDLRLLAALAGPVTTAIENARLFEEVRAARENLQALSRRLVEVQEAERGHIARELHDETGQALSSLLLNLSLLEHAEGCPKEVQERILQMEALVDEMLENLHRLAMNLRPAALDHLGLVPTLEQYVETFGEQNAIAARFETASLGPERLPPEVETAIYRIVQEALTNVLRHAHASRVDVLLEQRGDVVVAIVEDDGVGFDADAMLKSGRLGLFGMKERAEMLGGRLVIESSPGAGTTIFVEVPYAHSHPDRR